MQPLHPSGIELDEEALVASTRGVQDAARRM
jgi:hypothetical protein